ncbi:MAG: T9SS type A sorting domain-containing protein, partial [Ignavibacteriota bacterium]
KFGHNTFIANGSTTTNQNYILIFSNTNLTLNGLNENFWGVGSGSNLTALTLTNGINPITNFHFASWANPSSPTPISTPYQIDFFVDCGDGFNENIQRDPLHKTLSIVEDTATDVCIRLKTNGHYLTQASQWKQAADTLRMYIEKCANQNESFRAFTELDGAVGFMNNDNDRWLDYREWLKKVLYLNLDTIYYCQDVNSILGTFAYIRLGQNQDWNGGVAVIDYLLQNNRCPYEEALLISSRKSTRDKQVQIWRDTVGADSANKPLDTSAVTLESLDLQILKGSQFGVVSSPIGHTNNVIISLIATKNPFNDATALRYELGDGAALSLQIYDVLGKQVYSKGEGIKEPGMYEIQLGGKLFPEGAYFARLSTLSGEVKTVKLVHEK